MPAGKDSPPTKPVPESKMSNLLFSQLKHTNMKKVIALVTVMLCCSMTTLMAQPPGGGGQQMDPAAL